MKRTLALLTVCALSSVVGAEPLELDLIADPIMVPAPEPAAGHSTVYTTGTRRPCQHRAMVRKPLFSGVRAVVHGLLSAQPAHKGKGRGKLKGKQSRGVVYEPAAEFDYEGEIPAPEHTAPPVPPEVNIAPPAPQVNTSSSILPGAPRGTAFPFAPF